MKVLIACEESQAITIAMRKLGIEAYSCDLQDCSGGHPEWHIKGDALKEAYSGKYDLMIAHPPCFEAGTLIKTNEGLKKIEEIKVGNKVLTHLNNYKEVYDTQITYSKNILIIKTEYSDCKVTEEHPFYTMKKGDNNPNWVKAKDLTIDHYIGSPLIDNLSINKQNYFQNNGLLWIKVKSLEKIEWNDNVYNLSVEDDESYVANNLICHNCTFLSVSGARHLYNKDGSKNEERRKNRREALDFVKKLMDAPIKHIAIENPISVISTEIRKPDQIIQPWMFGDKASKSTCLWLKNLPLLTPTNIVDKGEFIEWIDKKTGKTKRQAKWYMDALKNAKTKEERQKMRSKTFQGIADAIALQYFDFIKNGETKL